MKNVSAALGFAVASLAFGPPASALTQPDGTVIPTGTGLPTLFRNRGEAINAQADAAIFPETFVPSCALTFTVLQRNADFNNSFGWYNVTGSRPALSAHHEFLSCTDPVSTVRVLDIRSDPRYLGGEIGFYQATGRCGTVDSNSGIFYSQRALNPDGNGAGTFIHLLIYNSTTTPRAFYFGWEDLLSGGDNDFDDLTTFVTGITCAGGGGPCDTGNPGICADGTLQCQSGELTCVQSNTPTSEACDGLDNDCDGTVDDGELCGASEICDKGTCVPRCNQDEFGCPPDKECSPEGYCVDPGCVEVTCPAGQRCIAGVCTGPCDGVVCPYGQVCRVGRCVDPCSAIDCDASQICVEGACTDQCQCTGCPAGQTCQSDGRCISDACVSVTCAPGQHCAPDGTCADRCAGATCPTGQACVDGQCVDATTASASSTGSGFGGGLFGEGGNGPASASASSSASGSGGGLPGGAGGSSDGSTGSSGSCGCRLAGADDAGDRGTRAPLGALPLLGLLGLGARLHRRCARNPGSDRR